MVLNWLSRVLHKFSWKTRTFGRGRRRTTWRKWVPWPNFDRLLVARLRFNELEDRVAPAIFTVTNSDDSGLGSLRQAILDANASIGADDIQFSVGTGAITIAPLSAMPTITEAVNIDATTQPGWVSSPIVELRGDSAGVGVSGFTLTSAGSTIRGFVINRFDSSGIVLTGSDATGNTITGNYIGSTASGMTAAGNLAFGVLIVNGASNNWVGTNGDGINDAIEGNVLSGNAKNGVILSGTGTAENVVAGNYIGTNALGTAAVPNGGAGITIGYGAATNNRIGTKADGIADAAERNIISGNSLGGIFLYQAVSNVIAGNFIGTDVTGTIALGNGSRGGIDIDSGAQFNRIGTTGGPYAAAERNIISGNSTNGITFGRVFGGSGTEGNIIAGNYIGTDISGTLDLGNGLDGILIQNGATNNTIGDTTTADGNVISGNAGNGVTITGNGTSGNTLAGNYIGLNADGTAALGNGGEGVAIDGGANGNIIGGSTSSAGNIISGNAFDGIGLFTGATGNVIQNNRIGTNPAGSSAIANGGNGITLNGAPDNDVLNNLISGNGFQGVEIYGSGSTGNLVAGNLIGTNAAGTAAIANGDSGVRIEAGASSNTIGGTMVSDRNVISGNMANGVTLTGASVSNNQILGNYIGTNVVGMGAIGNVLSGILISDGASNNTIGGTTAGSGNLISGNTATGKFQGIGDLPGGITTSRAYGVSADGTTVVGESRSTNGREAFVWTSAGGIVGLGDLVGGVFGSVAYGVSGNGTVVIGEGNSTVGGGQTGSEAFRWTSGGGIVGLGDLPGGSFQSDAQDISDDGTVIVGRSFSSADFQPYRWTSTGGMVGLGDLPGGGTIGAAYAVSGDGQVIVGNSQSTLGFEAFRWTSSGGMIGLGDLPGGIFNSQAYGVSYDGSTIIGNSSSASGSEAFRWTSSTGIVGLGDLPGGTFGSTANAVSADGNIIVGSGSISSGAAAFIWDQTNGMRNLASILITEFGLDLTGWTLTEARGISADGKTIVGIGNSPTGEQGWIVNLPRSITETNSISAGIRITGNTTSGNAVLGNNIGTNAAGTAALGNGMEGVRIEAGASNNVVGGSAVGSRNIVSGNLSTGVHITGSGSNNNVVAGNYIGLNAEGNAAIANKAGGVRIRLGAQSNLIGTNADGVDDANERNVVSGNTNFDGVSIRDAGSNFNVVAGNYLGTDATGLLSIPNSDSGASLLVGSQFNRIGTSGLNSPALNAVERNIIAGNGLDGIFVSGASNSTIAGNYIGINANGVKLANGTTGIFLTSGSNNNTIGTNLDGQADDEERNIISGNATTGIVLNGSNAVSNKIRGNFIGTNVAGTAAIANLEGIHIRNGANSNTIGGATANERNVISGNTGLGLLIAGAGSNNNIIRGNAIGTNPTGTAAIANGTWGVIVLIGSNNQIGGDSTLGQGNIISGNAQGGVAIFGTGAAGNAVRGNLIGVNAAGTAALGNAFGGVYTGEGSGFTITGFTTSGVATGTLIGGGGVGQGNVISGNLNSGVFVTGTNASATIQGNLIGTNLAGTAKIANSAHGIIVNSGATNVLIGTDGDGTNDTAERNVISGNSGNGIEVNGNSVNNVTIAGNYIGLNAAGNAAIGNAGGGGGIFVVNGPTNVLIGGTATGTGNVISGSTSASGEGIEIELTGGTKVYGNIVGLDATGTIDLGNTQAGVFLDRAWDSEIGGPTAAHRNIISGNNATFAAGVWMNLPQATNNKVYGNYIGTDKTGTVAIPNLGGGVRLSGGATGNFIGTNGDGTNDATEGNLISGNSIAGVIFTDLNTNKNVLAGNLIGTNAAGTAKLASSGLGLLIQSGSSENRIGTNADGTSDVQERNVISGNTSENIWITGVNTNDNIIRGNYVGTNALGTAAITNGGGAGFAVINGPQRTKVIQNVISGNKAEGLLIAGTAAFTEVEGNYVGTNAAGTAAVPNLAISGIYLRSGTQNNRIGTNSDGNNDDSERNVISGNAGGGIYVYDSGTLNNQIVGNYIGTNPTGTVTSVPVTNDGFETPNLGTAKNAYVYTPSNAIWTFSGTSGITANYTDWGLTDAANGNATGEQSTVGQAAFIQNAGGYPAGVISRTLTGFVSGSLSVTFAIQGRPNSPTNPIRVMLDGVDLGTYTPSSQFTFNIVTTPTVTVTAGNHTLSFIGTNNSGVDAASFIDNVSITYGMGNTDDSIRIANAAANTSVLANVIAGSVAGDGIEVSSAGIGTVICGNLIGTDVNSTLRLGNRRTAIYVYNTPGVTVGGPAVTDRNIINNAVLFHGIHFQQSNNGVIQNNYIGTNQSGMMAMPNVGYGIALNAGSSNTTLTNNVISGNFGAGVLVDGVGTNNNTLTRNYIGTNRTGLAIIANGAEGIGIYNGASGTRVGNSAATIELDEGNIISGNDATGIGIWGSVTNTVIAGNYIGVDASGTTTFRNQGQGIGLGGASTNTIIGLPGAGNVISGNLWEGITIEGVGSDNTVIQSNRVGTNAAGLDVLAPQNGIWIRFGPKGTRIGTNADGIDDAAEANQIAGNYTGVLVTSSNWDSSYPANGALTQGTVIAGNFIGTKPDGTTPLANLYSGVYIAGKASNTIVGGPTAASRNIISGNGTQGIIVQDAGTVGTQILGNYIGTNTDGSAAVPNNGHGIHVHNGAIGTQIGTAQAELVVSDWGNQRIKQFIPGVNVPDQLTTPGLRPLGVAVNSNGDRFVVSQSGSLWRFNSAGALVNTIATGLGETRGVAIGPDGHIYVTIHNTNQILRFHGTTFASMGAFVSGLNGPIGLNFGPDGILYVSESNFGSTGRLVRFNSTTGESLGQFGSLNLRWPSSPVWDASGNLYVTERAANTLLKLNGTTGALIQTLANGGILSGPEFLAVGPDGNIYVSALFHNSIQKYDPNTGAFLGYAVSPTAGLSTPHGIAFTKQVVAGNVISGNTSRGVFVEGVGTDRTMISGNFIGTNAAGNAAIAPTPQTYPRFGIQIYLATNTVVGTDGNGATDALERNVISGNAFSGIDVNGSTVLGTVIAGNIIGLDADGIAAISNFGVGVSVVGGAKNTRIGTDGNGQSDLLERNLISSSYWNGIIVESPNTDNTVIAGNYIGTDITGTLARPNGGGILLRYGPRNTRIGTDGSNDAFNANEGNLISGNTWDGIHITSPNWDNSIPPVGQGTDNTVIAGNKIGTNADGLSALANSGNGITVTNLSKNTRIGTDGNGTADDLEGNLVSGNNGTGIWIEGWTLTNLAMADHFFAGNLPSTIATANVAIADFADASSVATGNWSVNNPIPGGGGEYYFLRNTGTIQVNEAGTYSFALGSDNGGRLRIDGVNVVVDDTSHAFANRYGSIALTVGTHSFEWVGFETTGAAGFELSVAYGSGIISPVTAANGWSVLGPAQAGSKIHLAGEFTAKAYYPNPGSLNTTIAGNLVGTDINGSTAVPNKQYGVVSAWRSANVRIGTNGDGVSDVLERNVVSGNANIGVYIYGERTDNNVIAGNYIGVNKAGTAKIANGSAGVRIELGPKNTRVGTDGSNDAFNVNERNVISGNSNQGVYLLGPTTSNNVVAGNYLGLDATGTFAIGNGGDTVAIGTAANNNRIGTNADGIADIDERNVIAGGSTFGINISSSLAVGTNDNIVAGNYVGTNAAGTGALPNTIGGINLRNGVMYNRIGTNADGIRDDVEANLVSGNAGFGISIIGVGTKFNTIAGNIIGFAVNGTSPLANGTAGVLINNSASNNTIGGTILSAGNRIANNGTGILIDGAATTANSLRFNLVHNNLINFSFTNGANGGIVAPSIIGASSTIETNIFGTFQGTPNTTYYVDVYDPLTLVNPSTRTYLATTTITTGPTGFANFAATIPGARPFDSLLNVMLTSQVTGDSSPASIPVPVGLVVVEGTPTGLVAEGTPITFTTRASDPGPGETISYEWRVSRNNVTFDSGTESTFTFVPDDNGTYVITLSSATSTGLRDTIGPFVITVGNASPYMEFINPPANVSVGVPVAILAAVSDAGTADALTYEWLVNGAVLAPDVLNPRLLTLVPSQAGPISVELRVTDDDGETSVLTYAMLASGGLPTAVIDVPSSGKEGTVIHARAALADIIAQDNLTFAWSVTKNGIPFVSSGVASIPNFEFTPDDDGEYIVSLTVGVSNGPSFVAQNRSVFVQNITPEGRIEFDADGNGIADEFIPAFVAGTPIPFLGIAHDVGINDIHTFEWSIKNLDTNLVVRRGAGARFDFTALAAGTYIATLVTRDDDGGLSTVTKQIDVAGGMRSVSIALPPSATEGAESIIESTIAPTAPGVAFRYDWAVRKDGQVVYAATSPTYSTIPFPLSFTPPDDGIYEISLHVLGLDGSSGTGSASLVVGNVVPTVSIGVSAGPYFEGRVIAFTANASDPAGPNDTLSYQWLVNGVEQAGAKSSEFSFVPADNGSFLVEVVVRDEDQPPLSVGSVGFVNIVVENVAPSINLGAATDANGEPFEGAPEGYTFNFASGAVDPAGLTDPLSNNWSVVLLPTVGGPAEPLPASFASDPTAKYFSFDPNPAQSGIYILTLVVQDDDGGSATSVTQIVSGSKNSDVITVTAADLVGGASQIMVFGFGDNDVISASGTTFPVILDGGDGDDTLTGGTGNDVLFGGDGTDLLEGGDGNDKLVSQHGNDTLAGGAGNDEYVFNPGSDGTLNELGAGGIDTINFAFANSAILFDVRLNDGILRPVDMLGNQIAVTGSFEIVVGSNFGDRITASSGTTLFGGAGSDELRIESGTSNVTLFGGEGEDHLVSAGGLQVTLSGGDGNDLIEAIAGTTLVTLFGGAGDDDLRVLQAANITLFGGEGLDVLTLTQATNVTVFGGEGADTVNVLSGESIVVVGSDGQVGEVLPGLEAGVTLFGGAGSDDDVISILGGSSITVFGGEGTDAITLSNDVVGVLVSGGNGEDVLVAEGLTTLVTLFGGEGNDQFILLDGVTNVIVSGDDGRDLIRLTEAVSLITLFGGEGDDRVELLNGVQQIVVNGGGGIDEVVASGTVAQITLFGGEGDDRVTLQGSVQSVLVSGDAGAELINVEGSANQITLFGGAGDDAINVTGGANVTVFGGEGNDAMSVIGIAAGVTVFGGEGDDHVLVTSTGLNITVSGGEGNDTIETASTAAGNVTLFGGEGDDHLIVTAGTNVTVFGEAGSDLFEILNGSNITVFGGEGNDDVTVRAGTNVTVFGGEGDDRIQVDGGVNVTVLGAEGQDEMTVNAPTGVGITLFGGEGDDVLNVLSGMAVTIFGSEGNDAITVGGGTNVTVFGGEGNDSIVTDAPSGSSITLFGGEGDDAINVRDGLQVTIFGELGLDVITVEGGTNVTVFGGEGEDKISVEGGLNVTVLGGEAADQIAVTEGTNITVFGGDGNDTLTVLGGEAVTVLAGEGNDSLVANTSSGVTMFGGEGDDTISALVGDATTIFGESGSDIVELIAGSNITVFGGDGNDSVTVGKAIGENVTVFGGEGADTIHVEGGTQVTVVGEGGNDTLVSDAPTGLLITLFGGTGDDTIHITAGSQMTVFGESGNDLIDVASTGTTITVFGGSGDDHITATAGTNVQLLGDRGNDRLTSMGVSEITLFGGAGNDLLRAGGGLDVELFGDDGDDYYKILASANPTRVRVKEIQTLGEDHDPAEKLFLGDDGGTSHLDRGSTGTETLDLADFFGITINLAILGSDKDPLAGWQTVTATNGWSAVLILHGYFENVVGTAGNDLIVGNDFDNILLGGLGNDSLRGLAGNDSLAGGDGDDSLEGGEGNDTYGFSGTNAGFDSINEAADADADTLDFSGLSAAVTINLGTTGPQVLPGGGINLIESTGLEDVQGTAFDDTLIGNIRPNRIEGGTGDDALFGQAGNDTYAFPGERLGTDTITEQSGIDTIDFSRHLGGIVLDMSSSQLQWNEKTETGLILANPEELEDVIGSSFGDRFIGNAIDNVLIGGGGLDYLDGGAGNNVLRGGSGQVIYLDFTSQTDAWDWQYDAAMRDAILQRMGGLFKPFGYEVVLTAPAFGSYLTVSFNDGPQGGAADEIDFRNLGFGGVATVNVTDLLPLVARTLEESNRPVPTTVAEWTPYVVALSATIATHEAGHYLGLRHGDAYGPIGTGVNSAKQAARYLPTLPAGMTGAVETQYHVMASPEAHGISLLDSAGSPFFGIREAIKLAFADTGTTIREGASDYNEHNSFTNALPLGRMTGLSVPNTLLRPSDPLFGQSLAVAATTVLGAIVRDSGDPQSTSENDVYSFAATSGEVYHFEINSYNLTRIRNPIDSVLKIYDSTGKLLLEADDEFETADAVIVDWIAPNDGEFYLVVDTYSPDGIRDFDTGQYELFAYRVAVGADLGLGDTIVSSGGADQILTSTGRDRIKVRAGASAVIDVKGEADPIVDTTEGGSFTAYENEEPVDLPNISVNTSPTLDKLLPLPVGIPEGQTIKIQLNATDTDLFDRLTYRVEPIDGYAFPSLLTIGAVDGILQWTPLDEGTYGFRIAVTDIVGAEAAQNVIVIVDNLNPSASMSGSSTVTEGSAATFTSLVSDPGPIDVLTRRWTIDGVEAGMGSSLTFIPTENRVYTIGLTVEDGDGGTSTVLQSLTVNNLPPLARIDTVSGIPDERSPLTLIGSATDAGGADDLELLMWTIRKNGTIVADGTGTTLSWTPDDDGLYNVTFAATDGDGATHSDTKSIRIYNRAPVVASLPALTVVEGDPANFLASFVDNPSDAPFTILWRVTSPSTPVPDGAAAAFGFTTADSGTYTVLLKVTDKDGASTDVLTTVTVTERVPTATFQQNGPIFEIDPVIVSFANPDDAPADMSAGLKYSFARTPEGLASTYAAAGSAASGSFVLPDNGSYTVYGRVIDQNGAYSDYSTIVVVNNSAPKATIANAGPVVENSPVTVSLTNPIDGLADLAAGLKYSFAMSAGELAGDYATAAASSSANITFEDSGTFTVFGRVFDKDGSWTDYTTTVTVMNVAPTATFASLGPVNENSPSIVSFTNALDDSPVDLAAGLKYSLALMPDDLATSYATAHSIDSKSFTFPDNGINSVFGRIFDKDGGVTSFTTSVTVLNEGPTAGISGPTSVMVGHLNQYTLTSFDPSPIDQAAGFTFEIDWNDDGTIDQTVTGLSGMSVSHTFAATGLTSVRVRAIDKDLLAGTEAVLPVNVQINTPTVAMLNDNLVVTGTLLDNVVRINRDGSKVLVRIDSVNYGSFAVPGSIIVYAGEGNDDVRMDPDLSRRAELYGQDGNDTLRGGAGADRLDGGVGNDSLVAEYGNDSLFGGAGDDILKSGYGDDLLDGGDGNDSLLGSYGRDLFRGGSGNDTMIGGDGNDTAFGEWGDDFLVGGTGNDSLDGGEGNDTISGGDGRDTVFAGYGNDSVLGGFGNDYLDAGDGDDTVSGGADDDTIFGGAGDDRLEGNADNDRIDGGLGFADTLVGGDGNDILTDSDGAAQMSGGAGTDSLTVSFALTWNLGGAFVVPTGAITGGDGNDTIRVTANHANLTFEVDGNGGNDMIELYGNWKMAKIIGGAGTDRLRNRGVGLIELHGIEIQE